MATQVAGGGEGNSPPATAAQVANEFLNLAQNDPGFGFVDQMKLQKLLFYAHAWHLAYGKGPLFENDFEAWPWGPVVRDIYNQTRDFGKTPLRAGCGNSARVTLVLISSRQMALTRL